MKRSVFLLVVFSWLTPGVAQQTDNEQSRFEAVVYYWEWTSYFGVDGLEFPRVKYQPGRSFEALIFFEQLPDDLAPGDVSEWGSSAYWGFCSATLGVCHAYSGSGDGTLDYVKSMKIKNGETEEQVVERFRETNFWDDQFGPPEEPTILVPEHPGFTRGPALPPPTAQPGTGAPAISLTAPALPQSSVDAADFQTRHGQILLPKLDLPIAVRRKISNQKAERAAKEGLRDPNDPCTITIPYADERTAAIPILSECPDGAVVVYAQGGASSEYHFSHGGLVEDKGTVRRLAPRIRNNASLVLKESADGH